MKAILRRGRSLRLAASKLTLRRDRPQRLDSVEQYVYLCAAHTAVELQPPPLLHTVQRGDQRCKVHPWQLRDLRRQGWQLCSIHELMRPGADVLVIRQMGLGDVLMLTPALQALHTQRQVQVHLATYARYLPVVRGLDFVHRAYALGSDYQAERFALTVDLNWTVEWGDEVEQMPRQDIFAQHLGVKLSRRQPHYRVTSGERRWAQRQLSMLPRPLIGIQTHASCPQRSYPYQHVWELIRILQGHAHSVLTLGQQTLGPFPARTVDLTGMVSVREAAALIEQMDLMICPDSGLLHLAVAVGTPTLGLFGPIPPWLRVAGYPRCVVLAAVEACGCLPCFDRRAPRNCDCQCMKALSPQQVAETALSLIPA